MVRSPAFDAWLVELVLAWQLAEHIAALKVTQTDLSGKAKGRKHDLNLSMIREVSVVYPVLYRYRTSRQLLHSK